MISIIVQGEVRAVFKRDTHYRGLFLTTCIRVGNGGALTLGIVLVLAVVVRDLAEESRAAEVLVVLVAGLPEHG